MVGFVRQTAVGLLSAVPHFHAAGATAVVSASPTSPVSSSANITVSWSGVAGPMADDWVGAYCPWNSDTDNFVTYVEVGTGAPYGKPYKYGPFIPFSNASASTWAEGHGSVSFFLPNIRCDYEFVYLRRQTMANGTSVSVPLAVTATPVTFPQAQPLGIHLSVTNKPSEMRVNWVSGSTARPLVWYRARNESHEGMIVSANSLDTYGAIDLCGSEAAEIGPAGFIDPGFFYTAVMPNLKPNTIYEYQVMQGDSPPSAMYSFRSPPRPNDPVAFLMWADMGTNQYNLLPHFGNVNNAMKLVNQVVEHEAIIGAADDGTLDDATIPVGLVTHVGDLSYGCGNGFIWEQWQDLIQPIATHVPYMVSIGNHEYDHEYNSTAPGRHGVDISGVQGIGFHPEWGDYRDDSFGECGVTTAKRFTAPQDQYGSNGVFWYSYNYGPIHFLVWSAEHNFTNGSRQYNWILKDLAIVNRALTPWLIVQMHRPMYASEAADGESDKHLVVAAHIRENLEAAFLNAKVDLVMTGHLHSYERTCAVLDNGTKCDQQQGIVNLRVGTAGGTSDDCKAADPLCPNNDTMHFMPNISWREVGLYEYGYTRITVPNASALHIEFILNNNTVKDDTWIMRDIS